MDIVRVDVGHPALAVSPALVEALVTASAPAACDHRPALAVVRRQRPYALLGPRDLRLPDVGAGVAWLARRGLPAYTRIGGGSLVVLDEGCLSFAVAWPCRNPAHAGANARALARPALAALEALGVAARQGAARGSYCEGPSDLVTAAGRKVAGLALAQRGGWAVAGGMLLVRQDPVYATALVQGFERAAGGGRRFDPRAVTSLEEAGGRRMSMAAAAQAMVEALTRWAREAGETVRVRPPTGEETARAAVLLARRRVEPAAGRGAGAGGLRP
jgi:octanoyl-[GcvH]:protein N-octanoyltransferase